MNKALKTILIISIAIFGAGVLFISPTQAQPPPANLEVDFQETPLFDKTNFLPGDDVIRWVKVTNNSGENQEIGVNVTGHSECLGDYCLSDELNLVISKDGSSLYTGSLTDFYKVGEIYLSNLPNGNTNQYDFSITFIPETENNYQGLGTSFNFEIGFWGESISGEIPPGDGGGGGGVFIAGLEIYNERVSEIGATSVTIIWDTNKKATSRVIYSSSGESYVFDWTNPPNYGYSHSTSEYHTPASINGVIVGHTVYITGLETGITYYYRCVSHTSPDETISTQHSFTTKEVAGAAEEIIPLLPEAPSLGKENGIEPEVEGEFVEEEIITEEEEDEDLDKFLATAGAFMAAGNLCWLLLLVIIILIVLSLIYMIKKQRKEKWILPACTLIAAILYYFLCCRDCWTLIIVALILLILSLIFNKKKKEAGFQETP